MKSTIVILLIIAVGAGVFFSYNKLRIGKTYKNLSELEELENKAGFVLLGKFGDAWPAKIVETKTERDEISFVLKNGAKHTYPGYTGYELRFIRLQDRNKDETAIIFRSREKQ